MRQLILIPAATFAHARFSMPGEPCPDQEIRALLPTVPSVRRLASHRCAAPLTDG